MTTPAIADRFERERLKGLAAEEEKMSDMLRHEYARDAAKTRLRAVASAETQCLLAIEAALHALQVATGCADTDVAYAMECTRDTVHDMTYDARCAIEDEIAGHEDAIDLAEEADLQRSAPVRL